MWSQVSACEEDEGEGGGRPLYESNRGLLIKTEPWKETNQGIRGSGLIWP